MSLVSFVRAQNGTKKSMKTAIIESLDLIGYSLSKNIGRVVIKPNMCYYWDATTGQTTDPKFVAALIDIIREKNSSTNISIVESDASAMKCNHVFKMLGYEQLAKDYGVNLVNLSEDEFTSQEVTVGSNSFDFMIPQTIQRADLNINISKIKYTVDVIKLTCALKNIYGCNPYPKKFKYHRQLADTIVAINKAMPFDLCLIDGIIVSGMQPCKLGLVMASRDPVAIDVAAAKIASINPKKIPYLKLANKEGLGNLSFTAKGMPLNEFKNDYPKKTFKNKFMGRAYTLAMRLGLGKRLGLD